VVVVVVWSPPPLLRHRVSALHTCSRYVQDLIHSHLLGPRRSSLLTADMVISDFRTASGKLASADPRLPTQPYILFVGALRRIKGVDVLIAAYDRLTDAPPLVLIGTPSPDILPSLPQSAVLLENLSPEEVMAAWPRALFGVAPSVLPEPLGNVIHEGMSAGRPIIGTVPGGHGEMIVHEVNGLLVPGGSVTALAEAMQRLIDDQALRERLGNAAIRDAERFTEAEALPRFEVLFNTAVGDERGSGDHYGRGSINS
jgi:glycosyltransferase involved in cell wall biosynthesis